MDGNQDTPVLHRSNYRARGRVQSWWGEWKIIKKLTLQNLLKTKKKENHADWSCKIKKINNSKNHAVCYIIVPKKKNHAKSCKMVFQNHAGWSCKIMQFMDKSIIIVTSSKNHEKWCMIHDFPKNDIKSCKIMQNHAKSCRMVMQNHANHAQEYHQCDQLQKSWKMMYDTWGYTSKF